MEVPRLGAAWELYLRPTPHPPQYSGFSRVCGLWGVSLGAKSELQLSAYTTATATQDPSRVCDLHHSSRQRQILNLLMEPEWFLVGCVSAAP